jgi:hypothetical protein
VDVEKRTLRRIEQSPTPDDLFVHANVERPFNEIDLTAGRNRLVEAATKLDN